VTAAAVEPGADEIDDEFDLDIRIDDPEPAAPDRIYRAQPTGFASCSYCCPTNWCTDLDNQCSQDPACAN
jgi:hypothetical protein